MKSFSLFSLLLSASCVTFGQVKVQLKNNTDRQIVVELTKAQINDTIPPHGSSVVHDLDSLIYPQLWKAAFTDRMAQGDYCCIYTVSDKVSKINHLYSGSYIIEYDWSPTTKYGGWHSLLHRATL
jgi:hypothetical protein